MKTITNHNAARPRSHMIRLVLMTIGTVTLISCCAYASSVTGSFTLNGGGVAAGSKGPRLCWDAQKSGSKTADHDCFQTDTSKGTGTNGDVTNSDIAGQLAANMNAKLGVGTATATGAEVRVPNYSPSQPLGVNGSQFLTLAGSRPWEEFFANPMISRNLDTEGEEAHGGTR
jgi:hypothetical protein